MKISLTPHIGSIALLLSGLVFLILMYMLYWPVRTIEPRTQPYKVVTQTVAVGKPILYVVDSCKYVDLPALVTRQLVNDNGQQQTLPSTTSNVPTGCNKSISSTTVIPVGTPLGRYHLDLTLTYQINSFRQTVVRVSTERFDVVAQ